MPSDKIIVLISGIIGILFTYWFFFGKKEDLQQVQGSSINIKVDAGYNPSTIIIKKNQPVTLNFRRTDSSDCLEEIVIPEFKIKKYLPLNKEVQINIQSQKTGDFPFHCGMNMFHGRIRIVET